MASGKAMRWLAILCRFFSGSQVYRMRHIYIMYLQSGECKTRGSASCFHYWYPSNPFGSNATNLGNPFGGSVPPFFTYGTEPLLLRDRLWSRSLCHHIVL